MKILITGASSGIGKELAKCFAKNQNDLVLVARNTERLEELKNEILTENKVDIKLVSMDLSLQENCISLFNNNKNIDLLVNNAGFGDYGFFDETSLEKDTQMINTNILALHTLTKLYLAEMKAKNSGQILNVASIAGFMPGPLMATYYATKSYVVRLSEAINEELRRKKSKVKISILCPGPVVTNFEKTANIKFNFHGISSKKVAEYTVNHLNKFYIVPTCIVKIGKFFARKLSGKKVAKVIYTLQKKRSDK